MVGINGPTLKASLFRGALTKRFLPWLFLLAAALIFAACHKPAHDHHGDTATGLVANSKIFVTDEALQKRMAKIYQIMLNLHSPKQDGTKAAGELEDTVKDIFANCKLEPEADAAIHPILGDVLAAAALQKQGKAQEAMDKLHEALGAYEKKFSPTGW